MYNHSWIHHPNPKQFSVVKQLVNSKNMNVLNKLYGLQLSSVSSADEE